MKTHIFSRTAAPIAFLVAGLTLTQATLAPRQSHAIASIGSGVGIVPALIVMGAGAGVAGAGFGFDAVAKKSKWADFCYDGIMAWDQCRHQGLVGAASMGQFVGIAAILFGVLILDDGGAPTPDFQQLTPAKALEFGISGPEVASFNHQLDRINAVSESIARDIAARSNDTVETATYYAHSEWMNAKRLGLISANALSALRKMGTQLADRSSQGSVNIR
jgi:hypothetical protein